MLDTFISKIPFEADENRFLLVNTIFKRIKQLAAFNMEKVDPMTSDEIVDKAYGEIKTGTVKPIIRNGPAKEEKPKTRKKLKEIPFNEKPVKSAKTKTKVKPTKASKTKAKK